MNRRRTRGRVAWWAAVGLGLLSLRPVGAAGSDAEGRGVGLGESLAAGRVVTGAIAHRIVHFTFDDGPDASTTPRLLAAMDTLGVRATFFFSASRFRGGRRNARAAELARDALARGHSVGSHSVDHVHMHGLKPPALREQLRENRTRFVQVFGARTYLFRPPFGSRNAALDRMLHADRYTTVMWNLGLADWVRRPPEALAKTFDKVLAREAEAGVRGGVVLLHDTHDWSIDGFVQIVQGLQQRNCAQLAAEASGAPAQELFEIADDLSVFTRPVGDAGPGTDATLITLAPEVLQERQRSLRARERARCRAAGR